MTFNGRFLLNIIHFAAQRGSCKQKLLQLSGHSYSELNTEAFRVEMQAYNKVMEACLAATNDPFFGMHMGEYMNLSAAGLISQIIQTSSTVKEALEYCCEFSGLGCRALPLALTEEKNHFKLTFTPDALWQTHSPSVVQQTAEGSLVFTIREFQVLTRQQHRPLAVSFAFSQPETTDEYHRLLQCPVKFNQPETAIFFDKAHVNEPVITSNFKLLQILVQHAEEQLASLAQQEGFAEMVKRTVVHLANPQFPTIEQAAAHLGLSVRSLQRKLQQDQINFKTLIESLRKELALRYLKNSNLSINEVAFLLSYADASVFIRSFKRWTGYTPLGYRTHHSIAS
ncbi:AraC family transcriptional regulator ligand-binding domain-containing protein [Rapidithrix thailandica]|uniref:AraC family transcriptional regulator ligand-binding domain-containing protein n=1 Tax=Rapidithrix thailandica TaxID=413964 RepID=A0AAW9S3P6_9BACT